MTFRQIMKSVGKGLVRGAVGGTWATIGAINVLIGILIVTGTGEEEEGDV